MSFLTPLNSAQAQVVFSNGPQPANTLLTVDGYWDLGSYSLKLDPSNLALAIATVTFIKRRGSHKANIVWHEQANNGSPQQVYDFLTATFPSLEIFVEHTYLSFALHVYPAGRRPKTLAEKYTDFLPGFGRELLQDNSTRKNYYFEWVEEDRQLERRDFLWSLLERSKRDLTRQNVLIRKLAVNAAILINRFDSFVEADLEGVQLPSAKLVCSLFNGANVSKADLSSVDLQQSSFEDVDFRGSACQNVALGRLPKLNAHGHLQDIVFSSDQRLIFGRSFNEIFIWKIKTCESLPPLRINHEVTATAFSDSGCLALGDIQGNIHLWKEVEETGNFLSFRILKISNEKVTSIQFSHLNQSHFIVGTEDGFLSLWSIDGNKVFDLKDQEALSPILSVSSSPNKSLIASLNFLGELKLWELQEGKKVQQWSILDHSIPTQEGRLLRFSTDGQFLATQVVSKVCIWNISGQKVQEVILVPLELMKLKEEATFTKLCLSGDFNYILYMSDFTSGGICIQSLQNKQLLRQLNRESGKEMGNAIILSKNESMVAVMGWTDVSLWEVRSLMSNSNVEPIPFAFHFASQRELLVASWYPTVIASTKNNFKDYKLTPVKLHAHPVVFSPDGSQLISFLLSIIQKHQYQLETIVTDSSTGKIIWRLPSVDLRDRTDFLLTLPLSGERVLSPDNRFLAANIIQDSESERQEVWDMTTHTCLRYPFHCDKGKCESLIFTKNSKNVILSFETEQSTELVLWDLEKDEKQTIFKTTKGSRLLSIASDGSFIFRQLDAKEGQILIWDPKLQKILHSSEGLTAAYHPQKGLIARSGRSLSLIHMESKNELNLPTDLSGLAELEFSDDGCRLAARIIPYESLGYGFCYLNHSRAILYLWEIETVPYLHARLIDKLPHELNVRGAKFDSHNSLSDFARRVLVDKGAEINDAEK